MNFFEIKHFFDNPKKIRDFALNQMYQNYVWTKDSIWSGFRCPILDKQIKDEIHFKLEAAINKKIIDISYCFHLNPAISMHGYPHTDSDNPNSFAGVIYLSEEYPKDIDCGTTLYENLPNNSHPSKYILDYIDKMGIVYDTTLSPNNKFKLQFSNECIRFKSNILKKIKTFDFEFNKLVCYPGTTLHSPDFYFGGYDKSECRLTIAFHGKLDAI